MSTISPYYELNKYSDQLQDCSCKLISCNTWYKAPLGLLGLAASVIARVVEGAFMILANVFLALKYLCVEPEKPTSIFRPTAKPPSVKQPLMEKRVVQPALRSPIPQPSAPSHKFLPLGPRQSPGIEIVEEGGSIEAIQPPSSTTQSRELSRKPQWQEFTGRSTSDQSREIRLEQQIESPPSLEPLPQRQPLAHLPILSSQLQPPVPPLPSEDPLAIPVPCNDPLSPNNFPVIILPAQSNLSLDMNFPPVDEACSAIPKVKEVANQALNKMSNTCGTRIHARAIAGFSALRANKAASIAVAGIAGIAAAGAIALAPSILPFAGALAVSKLAWDRLRPGER